MAHPFDTNFQIWNTILRCRIDWASWASFILQQIGIRVPVVLEMAAAIKNMTDSKISCSSFELGELSYVCTKAIFSDLKSHFRMQLPLSFNYQNDKLVCFGRSAWIYCSVYSIRQINCISFSLRYTSLTVETFMS